MVFNPITNERIKEHSLQGNLLLATPWQQASSIQSTGYLEDTHFKQGPDVLPAFIKKAGVLK